MKKKLGISILIIALVVLGISAVALRKDRFKNLSGTPAEKVMVALENTAKKLAQENEEKNKQFNEETINAILNNKTKEFYFNSELNDIKSDIAANLQVGEQQFKGDLNLKGELILDPEYDMTSNVDVDLEFYGDADTIGINVPQLFETPYMINLKTLEEDIKNSPLINALDLDELTIGNMDVENTILENDFENAFNNYLENAQNIGNNPEFLKDTLAVQKEILKSLDLQESTLSMDLSDDSQAQWTEFSCTLDNKQIAEIIKKELDYLMKYDFAKEYFEAVAKTADMTVEEFMAELDNSFEFDEDTKLGIKFVVDDYFFRGITVKLFQEGTDDYLLVGMQYKGNETLTDDTYTCFELNASDLMAYLKLNKAHQDTNYTSNLSIDVKDDDVQFNITYNNSCDPSKTDDNLKVDFNLLYDTSFEPVKVVYSAEGTRTVNDDKYEIDLTNGNLIVQDSLNKEIYPVPFTYGVKTISESDIQIDADNAKNILTMDEDELNEAIEAIQNNLSSMLLGF